MFIKRSFVLITVLFASTIFAAEKPVLNIQHWQTQNGANAYFVQSDQLPMLDIQVAFAAGSAYDQNQYGVAQLTNNLLDEGTKELSADQIANQFANVGAIYTAGVDRDMATVGLRSLVDKKYFDPALKTFIDVLSQPTFPKKEFERLQSNTLTAIEQQQQLPSLVAQKTFMQKLYGNQPYGHATIGTTETIKTITLADVRKFYQQHYVAKNAIIAMVGDISLSQAKDIAEQLSASLPAGSPTTKLAEAQAIKQSQRTKHIAFPASQTTLLIGQIGINRTNPDRFPLYVGNYILGGGMTSRLYQNVRETRGLAYTVSSGFSLNQYRGPFAVFLQTKNNQTRSATSITNKTLTAFLARGPSKKELTAAKQHIIGAFPLGIASNSAILANLINIGFYGLPTNYLDTYRDKIEAVTNQQIRQAFNKYIKPQQLITVSVGG